MFDAEGCILDAVLHPAYRPKERLIDATATDRGFRIDIEMRQHEFTVGGEGAEHMSGGSIVEFVDAAAQGLAVHYDAIGTGLGVPFAACSNAA